MSFQMGIREFRTGWVKVFRRIGRRSLGGKGERGESRSNIHWSVNTQLNVSSRNPNPCAEQRFLSRLQLIVELITIIRLIFTSIEYLQYLQHPRHPDK